jgi:hypothetical protein
MSQKEWQEFLTEVSRSLYDPFQFRVLEVCEYREKGFKVTILRGSLGKSYSQPMIDYKDDHKHYREDGGCYRCKGELWMVGDDDIIPIRWYPVFNEWGDKDTCLINFDPDFAATKGHP